MENTHLTIILIILLIIIIYKKKFKNNEHFVDTISAEAIANIASLYNTDNMTVSNMTSTGNLTAQNGMTILKGGTSIFNASKNNTIFPYTDGKNYIRGDTQLDGSINVLGHGQFSGSDNQSLKITNEYSDWPGKSEGKGSEISNNSNMLMIVGNKGGNVNAARTIGLWDNVTVDRNLTVKNALDVKGALDVQGSITSANSTGLISNDSIYNIGCFEDHCSGTLNGSCNSNCGEPNNHSKLINYIKNLTSDKQPGYSGTFVFKLNNGVIIYWYIKTDTRSVTYGPIRAVNKMNTLTL
jgi:hypothetical protein